MKVPKLLSAAAFALLVFVGSDQHVFGVDGAPILCVPESDMDPWTLHYADESTHLRVGSGHTPGFRFLFTPEAMTSTIKGYRVVPGFDGHPYANALSGSLGFLSDGDRARLGSAMRARDTEDEWYARGKCPQPVVTPLEGTGLYEVRCSGHADYSTLWNRPPDAKAIMPNPNQFVVATCQYESMPHGPYQGKGLKTCRRVATIDSFLVDYEFQEDNARLILQIDSMIRRKISEWRKNCSQPA